jgi:Leucine-rich repeat (LRR) protein
MRKASAMRSLSFMGDPDVMTATDEDWPNVIRIDDVAHLPALANMAFWDVDMTRTVVRTLGAMSQLTSLELKSVHGYDHERDPPPHATVPYDSAWRFKDLFQPSSRLATLTLLDLISLRAHDLDGIGQLAHSLTRLSVVNCGLGALPDEIGFLHKLERLDLDSNALTQLPSTMAKLTSLGSLDVSANYLETVPAVVLRMRSLRFLGIADNVLGRVPTELEAMPSLELVDLQQNDRIKRQVREWAQGKPFEVLQ